MLPQGQDPARVVYNGIAYHLDPDKCEGCKIMERYGNATWRGNMVKCAAVAAGLTASVLVAGRFTAFGRATAARSTTVMAGAALGASAGMMTRTIQILRDRNSWCDLHLNVSSDGTPSHPIETFYALRRLNNCTNEVSQDRLVRAFLEDFKHSRYF